MSHSAIKDHLWKTSLLALLAIVIGAYFSMPYRNVMEEASNGGGRVNFSEINLANVPLAVWLWESPISMTIEQINEYLTFCEMKKVDIIYLYADDILDHYDNNAHEHVIALEEEKMAIERFVVFAHNRNIDVHALGGAPDWAEPEGHQAALAFFDFVTWYNDSVDKSAKIDGIQYDIEPYALLDYEERKEMILWSYLDLAEKVVNKVKDIPEVEQARFELGFAIPYWFDGEQEGLSLTWQDNNKKSVGFHLFDLLNQIPNSYVVLMDYRNFARGADGSIAHAEDEASYIKNSAQRVKLVIGQEVSDVKPSKITFFSMEQSVLEMEMQRIIVAFQSRPFFDGLAIHDLESYMKLSDLRAVKRYDQPDE